MDRVLVFGLLLFYFLSAFHPFLTLLKTALGFSFEDPFSEWGLGRADSPSHPHSVSKDGHCIPLAIAFTLVMGDLDYPERVSYQTFDGTIGEEALSSHGGAQATGIKS